MLQIRRARPEDQAQIWSILEPVIREGETYDYPRDTARDEALASWLAPANDCFVAHDDTQLLGTYVLHPNRNGAGAHVANCGYMTAQAVQAKGVGAAMCQHSLQYARDAGYRAMQFNFVVASNERAVALWQRMGFNIVGRVPEAFLHPRLGYVDALVMHQRL